MGYQRKARSHCDAWYGNEYHQEWVDPTLPPLMALRSGCHAKGLIESSPYTRFERHLIILHKQETEPSDIIAEIVGGTLLFNCLGEE